MRFSSVLMFDSELRNSRANSVCEQPMSPASSTAWRTAKRASLRRHWEKSAVNRDRHASASCKTAIINSLDAQREDTGSGSPAAAVKWALVGLGNVC